MKNNYFLLLLLLLLHTITVEAQKTNSIVDLLTIDGITLGKTTIKEAKILHYSCKNYSYFISCSKPQMATIYDNNKDGVIDKIDLIVCYFPKNWETDFGFDKSLSYNEWILLLEKYEFTIIIKEKPHVARRKLKRTLNARFKAISKSNKTEMVFVFFGGNDNGEGYSVDSKNTLLNINIYSTGIEKSYDDSKHKQYVKPNYKPISIQRDFASSLPPILTISDITFSENILDAQETAQLTISIKNTGPGDAKNVAINLTGYLQGLSFPSKTYLPTIPANGGTESITISIKGDMDLPTSEAIINIEIIEPNFKVKIQGKQLQFPTREFKKPELILAQYAVIEKQSGNSNNQIDINEIIDLKFAVQNIGQGSAENVNIKVENNQSGVLLLGVVQGAQLIRQNQSFQEINSGKYKTVIYRYFVNSEFTDTQLKFTIHTTEKIGNYGFSIAKSFSINKELKETGYIRTIAKTDDNIQTKVIIENIPDFIVDVDTDIPKSNTFQPNTYALIIGNEDYSSKQKGLKAEQNVDYAINDALMFATYCEQTLGVPTDQIKYIKNATSAEINRGLNWINNLSEVENGNAKLIFYYSGHGLPHEQTKEAYLIPVDVAGTNLNYAIKLSDVYSKLSEHPAKQITVFLDACFSGGARNQGLIAMKSIKIKPKQNHISGNLVIFTSSHGDESSAVYREKHHGYFTYFLLKKLQETKGEVNYETLSNYINQSVRKETGLNEIIQTPQIKVSQQSEDYWKTWKLK